MAMNRIYCKCNDDGEPRMLIIRTEININYCKLDNKKPCLLI